MSPPVQVELLGPVRLLVDSRPVPVPGPRRRAVLALLAWPTAARVARRHLLKRRDLPGLARLHGSLDEFGLWREQAEVWFLALETAELPELVGRPESGVILAVWPAVLGDSADSTSRPVIDIGWSKIDMAQRYIHVLDGLCQRIASQLGGLLWKAPKDDVRS